MSGWGLISIGLGEVVAGSCEHGNKLSGIIKCEEFLGPKVIKSAELLMCKNTLPSCIAQLLFSDSFKCESRFQK